MDEIRNCKQCRFVVKIKTGMIGEWAGQCRKNPPVPLLIPQGGGVGVNSMFPIVGAGEYCFCFEKSILDKS